MSRFSWLTGLLALLFLATPTTAQEEPTVEDVLSRTVEALGGRAAWDAVESLRFRCHFSTFSEARPCTIERQRPNRYRFEYFYNGLPLTDVYDGERSWWENGTIFAEVPWPQETSGPHRAATGDSADFGGPLLDADARGHRIELVGAGDVDGQPSWELRVHRGGAESEMESVVETWHVDQETFLPIARHSRGVDIRMPPKRTEYYSDYRQVGDLVIAHHIEIELGFRFQELVIDEVEINPALESSRFRLPIPDGMERLRSLAGDWDVQLRSRGFPDAPWEEQQLSWTIEARLDGALLADTLEFNAFGARRRIARTLSWDRFEEVYRATRLDTLTGHNAVLEGAVENDSMILAGASWNVGEQRYQGREVMNLALPSGFQLRWEVSTDDGETWAALLELEARRR